jgi:hypothetical protein
MTHPRQYPAVTPLVGAIHIRPRHNRELVPSFESRPCPHCGGVHIHGWPPDELPGSARTPHCHSGGPPSDFHLVPIALYVHCPLANWHHFPRLAEIISDIERNCNLKARVASR